MSFIQDLLYLSALGALAFNLVLGSQFAEAQTRCQEAQRLANEIGDGVKRSDRDDLIFIQDNLAHALLFQGHYDEALAIYRQYWDKPLMGKTFGEMTLEDFRRIRQSGPHACRSFSDEAGVVRFNFQIPKPMMNYLTSRGVGHAKHCWK